MFSPNIPHIVAQRIEDIDRIDAYLDGYSNRPSGGEMLFVIILTIGFIYAFYYARKFIYEWQLDNKRKLKEQEPRVCRDEKSEVIGDEVQKKVVSGQEGLKKTKPVQEAKQKEQKLSVNVNILPRKSNEDYGSGDYILSNEKRGTWSLCRGGWGMNSDDLVIEGYLNSKEQEVVFKALKERISSDPDLSRRFSGRLL